MKISTALDHGVKAGQTYAEAAKSMKDAGFEGIDLAMCKHQDKPELVCTDEWLEDVIAQADAAKHAGLEIAQCHMPYYPGHIDNPGDGTPKAFGEFMLPMYYQALRAVEKVGCKTCVVHPFYLLEGQQQTIEGNAEVLYPLIKVLDDLNVDIALENVFARRNGQYITAYVEQAETLMGIVNALGSKHVGICLDTGHANIFRFNIQEMAKTFGKKLFALHVNSNAGHDEHSIPYAIAGWCERMDFEQFTRTLNDIGYEGWYNLEINGGRFPKNVAPMFYGYAAGVARYLADIR